MIEPRKRTELSYRKGLMRFSIAAFFLLVSNAINATDFFWVGNSGNWNENIHWSLTSGGAGGAGIPSSNDNVFFDENSFTANSVVSINSSAYCNNIIWEGTSKENEISGTGSLNVGGSFVFQDKLKNGFLGDINLNSSASSIIKAGKFQWLSNILINSNGIYDLEGNFGTHKTKAITVESGTLNTNGYIVYTGAFLTRTSNPKTINLGTSTVKIFSEWDVVSGNNLSLNASNSIIEIVESVPQSKIKKGGFDYGTVALKAACATPIPIDFTVTITTNAFGEAITCNGDCDAEIVITVNSGGGGPYGYGYDDGGGEILSNSNTINGLCADTYNVTVYDSAQLIFGNVYESCTEFGVVISAPSPIGINVQGFIDPTCPSACDGTIFTAIGGGTGALTIEWPTIAPFPFLGEDPTAACTGTQTVEVTDEVGCFFTDDVTVTDPPPIVPVLTVYPVSCNNVCDGAIVGNSTGGNGGPYTYTWDGGLTPNSDSATGLCELTTYNVIVADVDGCTTTANATVPDRDSITITPINPVNPTCFGVCNGEIGIGISGGSGNYTAVNWATGLLGTGGTPFAPTGLLNTTNLCAGTNYIVYVTDDNGCTDSLQLPVLTSPTELIISETHIDILCFGDGNGTINTETVGGTPFTPAPDYTYEWTVITPGGGEVPTAQNQSTLSGGEYQVVATDALGCTDTLQIAIFEPEQIYVNGIDIDNACYDSLNANIDVSTSGGMGPGVYTFSWTSTAVGFVDPGTEDLMGLDSGAYTLTVVDTNMCSYDTTFIITTPGELFANATITPVDCNGDATGEICLNPANGTTPYEYDIPVDGTYDGLSCGSGLLQGTYTVSVRDSNMCVKDTIVVVTEPPAITGTLTASPSSCGGSNGSISAVISGGSGALTYQWFDSGGNPVGGNSATLAGVAADCYDLTYTDVNGCIYTDQACVTDDAAPSATFVTQDLTCYQSCDGSILTTITGGTLPYTISWTSTDPGFVNPGTADLFLICAGDYDFTVSDANGCIFTQTETITEPDQLVGGNSIVTDVLCFEDSTGSIDATISGGTVAGAYLYSWTGPGFTANTEDIANLPLGTYCLHVEDDNACSLDTCIDINEPPALALSYTTINAQCGVNDGEATVIPAGGTPAYTYSWPSGNNTDTDVGLGAGTYTVVVQDNNLCTDSIVVAVSENIGITIIVDGTTDVLCNGGNEGSILTTVSAGNPYTIAWTSVPAGYSNNAEDISLLTAGTYIITVTDDFTGCQTSETVIINEPNALTLPGVVTDPNCFGQTGTVDITPAGGTAPYNFNWDDDGTSDPDTDNEDLIAIDGIYNVIGYDINGCSATAQFTLTEPTEITTVTSNAPTSICGLSDGSVDVVAAGGTPGYSYIWSEATSGTVVGNSASMAGVLPSGCYNVDVTDASGCTVQDSDCISDGGQAPLIATPTGVTCFGGTDGQISVATVEDSLVWTGPQVIADDTNPAMGLMAGSYTVELTDNGCVSATTVDVLEPNEVTLTETLVDPDCFGDATGSITLVINDAVGATGIIWTGPTAIPDDSNPAQNLLSGVYDVTVTDANGCQAIGSYELFDNTILSLTSSNTSTSCSVDDGTATVVASGGVVAGDYNYLWDDSGTQNTATATGLGVGTFTVTVTDDMGCIATASETITYINGPEITLVSTSDVTCFGANDGSIFVDVTNGTLPYSYSWNTGDITEDLPVTGPGYDTLTVTDGAGCTAVLSDSIMEPALLTVSGVDTNPICFGDGMGAIDITVAGGTTPYTFDWTDQTPTSFSANEDVNGLGGGTFDVLVTDLNNCTATYSATLTEPTAITLTSASQNSTCGVSDGAVSVAGLGGTGAYTYDWEDVLNPGVSLGSNDTLFNQPAGSYEGFVTDASGCTESVIVAISDGAGPSVTSSVTNVVCFGSGTGAIDLTVVEPSLTFLWTGPSPFVDPGTEDISGLEGGTYTVLVSAASGCSTSEVITVGGPTQAISTTEIITDLICYNDGTGSIDITTTGGTPSLLTGYTYSWTGPNGFTSTFDDITMLDSGSYDLTVTDSNLCNYNVTYNVSQPGSMEINPTVTDATCGVADGTIATAVSGGDGNYTYAWTETITGTPLVPGTNSSESGLGAGVYEIVVTDGIGCTTTESVPLSDANGAPLTTVVSNVSCNGGNNGAIDLTVTGPNTYNYTWTGTAPYPGASTEDISSLSPGTYNVLVEDQSLGCFSATTVDIIEPNSLTISGLDTNLTCFASMNGSIDITVGGGTPTYSYLWTYPDLSTSIQEDLTGLDTGVYQVTATDINGCTIATQFTLTQPNSMILSSVLVDDNCYQGGNGSIDITVSQGTTPYTYNWSWTGNTSNNEDLSGLFADTYSLSIIDSNLCQKDTTFIIGEASQIIADVVVTDANCAISDGSATSNTTGGAGGYNYDWSPEPSITNTINAVPSGVYPLQITDANGCQFDTTITINDLGGPTITVVNVLDVSCFGGIDGGIDVSVSGATAPYTFLWNPNAISQVEDLVGAPADDYTIQVTDAIGCSSFETATINEPAEITGTYTTVDATCGICNGSATINAAGGSGGYTYVWSDNQTSQTATSLCAGVQTVQVTDINGCVSNIDVGVSSVGGPTGESILTTDATCNGGNDGTAEAIPVGGTTPYSYFWPHNGSTANPITGLSAGSYFVEISDANGCIRVAEAIISESTLITSSGIVTPSSCGGSDGAITTTATGGSGVYTYLWSNLDVTSDISGQPEGVYTLTVDDGNCSITEVYTIPGIGAPELTLFPSNTSCYNSTDGFIFSSVSNNVGIMSYQWYEGVTLLTGTNDNINSLPVGTYTLEGLDAGTGCMAYATIDIEAPDSIVLSIPTIIDVSCSGICDGEAYVVAAGGTLPYSYSWAQNTSILDEAMSLCVGADTVTITDANNCVISSEIVVGEPIAISIIIDSITDAFCVNTTDGEIFITANGGDGNYTYNWSSIPSGFVNPATDDISGLLPMEYVVSILDGNGCSYSDTIPVDTLNILIANAGLDTNLCQAACIDLIGTATGTSTYTLEWFDTTGTSLVVNDTLSYCSTNEGIESLILVATDLSCSYSDTVDVIVNSLPVVDAGPDYYEVYGTLITLGGNPTATSGTYQWSPTTNFTNPDGTDANPELSLVSNLDYIVTVTDTNGCMNSDTVNVEIFPEIIFPNGFSPNGDGINDTWQIDNIDQFPDAVVEVYNRWGQQLFISVGYVQQFDGTNEGKDLPVGTYYYIITLNHPEYPDAYTGPITIMR